MKYRNILQIDDDSDDCEFFEDALRTITDATYTSIQNPIDALRKLINGEIKPDIIFMDINMPFMSGLELLCEIKKNTIIKNIPVILLSTSAMHEGQEKVSAAKAYLVKPHTFNDLKNLLRQIII